MDINKIVSEEEFNNARELTYDQFCNFLMRVIKASVEESLRILPSVLNHLTYQATYLKTMSDNFYKQNPDLAREKELMAKTIEAVEIENPGMSYEQILEKSAKRARDVLATRNKTFEKNPKQLEQFDSKLKDLKLFEDE